MGVCVCTGSPKYSTSSASCRRILLSSVGPPLAAVVLLGAVFLACLRRFRLSSVFFTELSTSEMVSKYLRTHMHTRESTVSNGILPLTVCVSVCVCVILLPVSAVTQGDP